MDNQHKLIKGYRDLSAEEIALMNEVKAMGEQLLALSNKVSTHIENQFDSSGYEGEEYERLEAAAPFHWHSLATDDLQVGIMKLVRSIAQPTTF